MQLRNSSKPDHLYNSALSVYHPSPFTKEKRVVEAVSTAASWTHIDLTLKHFETYRALTMVRIWLTDIQLASITGPVTEDSSI
jgi:hypothetical protein